MTDREIVEKLYYALIAPAWNRITYEFLREDLIWDLGYDRFRDLQCEAFKLIGTGKKPREET